MHEISPFEDRRVFSYIFRLNVEQELIYFLERNARKHLPVQSQQKKQYQICSVTNENAIVVMVSLLLTLNVFHTFSVFLLLTLNRKMLLGSEWCWKVEYFTFLAQRNKLIGLVFNFNDVHKLELYFWKLDKRCLTLAET